MRREDTRYKGVFDAGYRAGQIVTPQWDGRVKLLVAVSVGLLVATLSALVNGSIMSGFLMVSAVVAFTGAVLAWPK